MSSVTSVQAISLDTLATPSPEKYAFESVWNPGRMEACIPMADILQGLGQAMVTGSLEHRYWDPARVVRGVIEYAPRDESYLPLLFRATRAAIELYANPRGCTGLDEITQDIERLSLGDAVVRHPYDSLTRTSEHPNNSLRAASRIAQDIDSPALFVPICHSGLLPGIQTALCYERDYPGNRIAPVMFSHGKQKQPRPQLLAEELDVIADASKDVPIVVYDDIAASGDTMALMADYLVGKLPKGCTIMGYVNQDFRPSWLRMDQGERWERCLPSGQSTFIGATS